jgi:hypothetical protein
VIEYIENLWHLFGKLTIATIIEAVSKAKFTFSSAAILILNKAFNFLDEHSAAIGALVCILSLIMNVVFKILERRDKQLAYTSLNEK